MIQNVYLVSYCFDRLIYSTILKQIQLSMIATGEESYFSNLTEDLFRNSNIALYKTRLFRDSNHPTLVSDSAKI